MWRYKIRKSRTISVAGFSVSSSNFVLKEINVNVNNKVSHYFSKILQCTNLLIKSRKQLFNTWQLYETMLFRNYLSCLQLPPSVCITNRPSIRPSVCLSVFILMYIQTNLFVRKRIWIFKHFRICYLVSSLNKFVIRQIIDIMTINIIYMFLPYDLLKRIKPNKIRSCHPVSILSWFGRY